MKRWIMSKLLFGLLVFTVVTLGPVFKTAEGNDRLRLSLRLGPTSTQTSSQRLDRPVVGSRIGGIRRCRRILAVIRFLKDRRQGSSRMRYRENTDGYAIPGETLYGSESFETECWTIDEGCAGGNHTLLNTTQDSECSGVLKTMQRSTSRASHLGKLFPICEMCDPNSPSINPPEKRKDY